jgi:hypothetical protein
VGDNQLSDYTDKKDNESNRNVHIQIKSSCKIPLNEIRYEFVVQRKISKRKRECHPLFMVCVISR